MVNTLIHLAAAVGPSASWIAEFCAAVVAVFVLYVGIAIWATFHAPDDQQRQVCYQIFRDLLDLFRRGRDGEPPEKAAGPAAGLARARSSCGLSTCKPKAGATAQSRRS